MGDKLECNHQWGWRAHDGWGHECKIQGWHQIHYCAVTIDGALCGVRS